MTKESALAKLGQAAEGAEARSTCEESVHLDYPISGSLECSPIAAVVLNQMW